MAVEPPIITLTGAAVTFGGPAVFEGLDVSVRPGERACLIGRNGCGKSTLLKVLAGIIELDGGERTTKPGLIAAYLPQEPDFGTATTLGEHVATALPPDAGPAGPARVATALARFGMNPDQPIEGLSGGQARRADLARAFVSEPDLVLLDEPTNHLDLEAIEKLEKDLASYRGAMVVISHDRAFLRNLSSSVLWMDRGRIRRLDKGYAHFDSWSEDILIAEEKEYQRLGKKLESETLWLRQGISARRTRNMGRVRALQALRKEIRERVKVQGSASMETFGHRDGARLLVEARRAGKRWGDAPAVDDFSLRVFRGSRIGLVGPNGAGKSTLLGLLTGRLAPDQGQIRLADGLEIAFFDQQRTTLNPDDTLAEALTGGSGDYVSVGGKPKHVVGRLRDFLFTDLQVNAKVRTLSGGERARLILARLLAQATDILALDEPTNDLDMDTLDLLQDALGDYPGAVLLVSHDRDFLDRVCDTVLAFEGDGRITAYAGGWTDMMAQRAAAKRAEAQEAKPAALKPSANGGGSGGVAAPARARTKLSYKDQRELDGLPDRIAALEAEIATLETQLHDPALYAKAPEKFQQTATRLDAAKADLAATEDRWLELEALAEEMRV